MSRKASQFASIITTPLNVYNFLVSIPGLVDDALNMVVEASNFPSYKFRTIELWTHGEKVTYPGLPEGETSWRVTVPENDSARMYKVILALYREIYDEKSGVLFTPKYRDVTVFARDYADNIVFSCILHGTWFKGKDVVNLVNNNPNEVWKWPLEFQFHWIEHLDAPELEGSKSPFRAE